MKDLFLADAHLKDPAAPAYRHLLDFLDEQHGQLRTLVLLGDIFEFWVGYRSCVFSAYLPVLQRLQRLHEQGTRLVVVEGNHDFHLGPFFRDSLQATIIPNRGRLELDGCAIHLEHGDLINADQGYLWLRRFFRSRLARGLIRILPPDVTWHIGEVLGNGSRRRHHQHDDHSRSKRLPQTALRSQAEQAFAKGCRAFLCGHFHHSWQQTLRVNQQSCELLVVGDWGTDGSYVELCDGQFLPKQYRPGDWP
ncbi:MAG: UDP-2,3-diacylglucosamine diphosphatase [Desulfuromonadaceae bacterium]|nr:UDP-2,3-diacylglucosamine diphosphatase [Desulfuromonadaceae bacterium]